VSRLLQALRHRRLAVILAGVLMLPSLAIGYFADDFILLHDLHAGGDGPSAAALLYRFSLHWTALPTEPQCEMPWWASPNYHTDFLRPLSGLLFGFDEWAWPGGGALAHAHSIAWWLLIVVAASRLLRHWFPSTDQKMSIATLSVLLLAIDDGHSGAVSWLANRHAVVAVAAVWWGLWFHVRFRDQRLRMGLPLSLFLYALGLAAGETAVQALAYVYCDELFISGRPAGRWKRLAPVTALLVAYVGVRKSLGARIDGSGLYFDPLSHPLQYLEALPRRLIVLLGDLWGGLPSDLSVTFPAFLPFAIGISIGVCLIIAALLWRAMPVMAAVEVQTLRALTLAAIGGLIIGSAGPASGRLLLAPSVGGAALVAMLLLRLPRAPLARAWLVGAHVLLAPSVLVGSQLAMKAVAHRQVDAVAASELAGDVVVISSPDPSVSLYAPYLEGFTRAPRFHSYRVLSFAPVDLEFERTGPNQLVLRSLQDPFFQSGTERLLTDRPILVGVPFEQKGMRALLTSPTEIVFDFTQDVSTMRFLALKEGALRRVPLPPIGERVRIEH
jgi:hypothetical protein